MPIGAYSQDVLTRAVNVHWGGAGFVYGECVGNLLHYVQDQNSTPQAISLPEPPGRDFSTFDPRFLVNGSSCAEIENNDGTTTKVYLVCGNRTVPKFIGVAPAADTYALIYASNDGVSWRVAREQPEIVSDLTFLHSVGPNGLVWDPVARSFYYDQIYGEFNFFTDEVKSLDQIFSSATGTGWGMVSSTETGSSPDYVSSFSSVYCGHNDCLDERGQHVPDGVMSTAVPPAITTIKPTHPPTIFYEGGGIGYMTGDSTVTIKRGEEVSEATIPGVGSVTCVAGRNGIFLAGGFVSADDVESAGAVAISVDDGLTWQPFASTLNGVTTMVAAPPSPEPSRRNARL